MLVGSTCTYGIIFCKHSPCFTEHINVNVSFLSCRPDASSGNVPIYFVWCNSVIQDVSKVSSVRMKKLFFFFLALKHLKILQVIYNIHIINLSLCKNISFNLDQRLLTCMCFSTLTYLKTFQNIVYIVTIINNIR